MCLLVRKEVNISVSRKGGHTPSMTQTSVTIQVNPESVPSTPLWMGEVAAVAHVLTHVSLLKAIQEHVQFARARFGEYDTIDFVVVLVGYALSGEATLQSFYERLAPFADVFMALFVAITCLLARPFLAFLPPSIKRLSRRCARSLRKTCCNEGLPSLPLAGCGIGAVNSTWSWMSMAPNRRLANELFPTFH